MRVHSHSWFFWFDLSNTNINNFFQLFVLLPDNKDFLLIYATLIIGKHNIIVNTRVDVHVFLT